MCITRRASATMGGMNKRELAKAVAVQADVELKTVITVIDGFTDVVTAVVSKGEPVSIPGFAKFVKVNRAARMGRNPATGEAIRIKASKKARITPVKAFKDAVLAPATAPKLVKGAYPTSDAAVAAAGKSAAPAAAKKAPARVAAKKAPARKAATARKAPARKAPARKAPARRGPGQEGREEDCKEVEPQGRSPHPGPAFCGPGPMDEPQNEVSATDSRDAPPPEQLADRPLTEPHPDRLSPDDPAFARIIRSHTAALEAGADSYVDPRSGNTVLTAAYLARRGQCCDSGCRHCPYVR